MDINGREIIVHECLLNDDDDGDEISVYSALSFNNFVIVTCPLRVFPKPLVFQIKTC